MTDSKRGGKDNARELAELKRRLEKSAPPPKARPAPPPPPRRAPAPPAVPPPPAEPEDPEAFEKEMQRLGVPAGTPRAARVVKKPEPAGPPRETRAQRAASDAELFERAMAAMLRGRGRVPDGDHSRTPVLDLHGFSETDALHELRRFVDLRRGDRAVIVRIVTGKGAPGEAVLRPAVQAWLERSTAIGAWRVGLPGEGGEGACVAQIKRRDAR